MTISRGQKAAPRNSSKSSYEDANLLSGTSNGGKSPHESMFEAVTKVPVTSVENPRGYKTNLKFSVDPAHLQPIVKSL